MKKYPVLPTTKMIAERKMVRTHTENGENVKSEISVQISQPDLVPAGFFTNSNTAHYAHVTITGLPGLPATPQVIYGVDSIAVLTDALIFAGAILKASPIAHEIDWSAHSTMGFPPRMPAT